MMAKPAQLDGQIGPLVFQFLMAQMFQWMPVLNAIKTNRFSLIYLLVKFMNSKKWFVIVYIPVII